MMEGPTLFINYFEIRASLNIYSLSVDYFKIPISSFQCLQVEVYEVPWVGDADSSSNTPQQEYGPPQAPECGKPHEVYGPPNAMIPPTFEPPEETTTIMSTTTEVETTTTEIPN